MGYTPIGVFPSLQYATTGISGIGFSMYTTSASATMFYSLWMALSFGKTKEDKRKEFLRSNRKYKISLKKNTLKYKLKNLIRIRKDKNGIRRISIGNRKV